MKEENMPGTETQTLPDLCDRWSELAIAGVGLTVPTMTQYRLDQPCVFGHGSVGGWLKDGEQEIVFTVLWRELRYWERQRRQDDSSQRTTENPRRLQEEYASQALRRMKQDSRHLSINSNETIDFLGTETHPGNVIDLTFSVRRRLRTLQLARRQVLWTCLESGRHLAFEISVLSDDGEVLNKYWSSMSSAIWCHGEKKPMFT